MNRVLTISAPRVRAPGARQTEGLMDGLKGGEADGRRRRKQAARPTTGEQAHRQKHGRTERWTDKRKLK